MRELLGGDKMSSTMAVCCCECAAQQTAAALRVIDARREQWSPNAVTLKQRVRPSAYVDHTLRCCCGLVESICQCLLNQIAK